MWPFRKPKSTIPEDCDFELVRAELAEFFRIANEDAAKEGGNVAYKQEFVAGWDRFAANPCMETAAAWLNGARDYESLLLKYFSDCSTGGQFYACRSRRKSITLKRDERSVEEQAKQFGDEIDSVTEIVPLGQRANEAFKLVILAAAHHCLKGVEQYIKADDDKDRLNKVFLVNCEFFYFFMHLANRRFYAEHGEVIGQRWQNELGPTYVSAFLESVIGHWPQEMKDRIRSDLYDKINDAERDYTQIQKFKSHPVKSEWQDLNLRPSASEADALPICATLRSQSFTSTAKGARTPTRRLWRPLLCHSMLSPYSFLQFCLLPSSFCLRMWRVGIEPTTVRLKAGGSTN